MVSNQKFQSIFIVLNGILKYKMAEGYVHIMLVGENITHVKMALQDSNDVCRKVKRLYLLHSPDESKKSGPKKKTYLI